MTRINVVPPSTLSQKHLTAEWHEIGRVVTMVENQIEKHGNILPVPPTYRMGTGHMQFFANKLVYISDRIGLIFDEMQARRMDPKPKVGTELQRRIRKLIQSHPHLGHHWAFAGKYAADINMGRLRERDPKFYGEAV